MGTDIHACFQARKNPTDDWQFIPSNWDQSRHYQLFAVLADVRNGRGFAGVPTGQSVTPIAMPRGIPDDFKHDGYDYVIDFSMLSPDWQKFYTKYDGITSGPVTRSLGDHSFSWLTATEMLDWYQTAPPVIKFGVVDRAFYEAWNHKTPPTAYSGGISGPRIVVINDSIYERLATPGWTHIRIAWEVNLRDELAYFFDEIQRLVNLYPDYEIRMVFGFDS